MNEHSTGLPGGFSPLAQNNLGETNDCWRNTKNTPSFAPTNVFLYNGLRAFNDLASFPNVD